MVQIAGHILFGNGEVADYFKKIDSKNEDGLDDWIFYILPTSIMQENHNFGEEFAQQGFIIRRYLKENVFQRGLHSVLITVDVNGFSTNTSRKDEIMVNKIHIQQREINNWQLKIAFLNEEINNLLNNPFQVYLDDKDIHKEIKELRKREEEEEISTDENE